MVWHIHTSFVHVKSSPTLSVAKPSTSASSFLFSSQSRGAAPAEAYTFTSLGKKNSQRNVPRHLAAEEFVCKACCTYGGIQTGSGEEHVSSSEHQPIFQQNKRLASGRQNQSSRVRSMQNHYAMICTLSIDLTNDGCLHETWNASGTGIGL